MSQNMPRSVAAQRFCFGTFLSQSVPNVPKHNFARPWHAPTGAINAVTDRAGVTWGQLNSKMGRVPKPIGRAPKGVRLADAISSGKGVLSRQVAATPRPCPCG
jgi:hypothetical protein